MFGRSVISELLVNCYNFDVVKDSYFLPFRTERLVPFNIVIYIVIVQYSPRETSIEKNKVVELNGCIVKYKLRNTQQ